MRWEGGRWSSRATGGRASPVVLGVGGLDWLGFWEVYG